MKELEQLFQEYRKNQWLFPTNWSPVRLVDKDLSFSTYFDDPNRTYAVFKFVVKDRTYEITRHGSGEWNIEQPINHPISLKKVIDLMKRMRKFFEDTSNELEQSRLAEIRHKRSEIRQLKKQLSILER